MAGVTTAVLGAVGVATAAYGVTQAAKGQSIAKEGAAQIKKGNEIAAGAAADQASASRRLEELRKRQMMLDAMRQRRQVIRDALLARSTALTAATYQGAEGGSGLQGAYGQITGRAAQNIQGIEQSAAIGAKMFDANAQIADAGAVMAVGQGVSSYGSGQMSYGQGVTGFGGSLIGVGQSIVQGAPTAGKLVKNYSQKR